jgi:hypothetical protein
MKKIPVKYALVDDEDYLRIKNFNYSLTHYGYAMRYQKGKYIFMHRDVLTPKRGEEVDHINGDKLDNRRENLRSVTRSQNNMNSPGWSKRGSDFKGVYLCKNTGRWRVKLTKNRKQIHVGRYDTQKEAAAAYAEAAKIHYGEYARAV